MKFNDPVVTQFVTAYGIKDLIDDLNLQKIANIGSYYMALCPFHDNTKEPDFQIHKKFGLWNCFGCGQSGNLYQFISLAYNLSYADASSYIEKLAGFDSNSDIEEIRFASKLRNMFEKDEDDAEDKIASIPPITPAVEARMNTGPDPFNYLLGRGYSQETIDYFECTYTDQWRTWDREKDQVKYEQRIVIPGHLEDGTICGYIGRTPVGDEPKYRYTKGYPKTVTLFNAHRAKVATDEAGFLIAVEGSLDVVNIHNLGFPMTVGILGASPSAEQIDMIVRMTRKVYLGFDNDKAGQIAMGKAINALQGLVDINILNWAPYKDPDEIKSREMFQEILNSAPNLNKFLLQSSLR